MPNFWKYNNVVSKNIHKYDNIVNNINCKRVWKNNIMVLLDDI